jgi:hypothetical protein
MGKLLGGQKYTPPPVPDVPPAPNAPSTADASVQAAGARARGGAVGGLASTIATSPGGLTEPASTAKKSLLGG